MDDLKEHIPARLVAMTLCVMAVLGLIVIMIMSPNTSLTHGNISMLSLHLLLELFAVIIALFVVAVSWHTVNAQDIRISNVLIGGFLIVASCDLVHALTYEGMPQFLSESSTPRAIFFWLMGRTFEVATMWLIAINWAPVRSRRSSLLLGLVISCLLIWFGSFSLDMFPVTFIKGHGVTPFKAYYELALCFLYISVAIILWQHAKFQGQSRYCLLAASSFIMGIGEVSFTAYATPSDFQNLFGHIYKLVAYGLLYRATFIVSIRTPFEVIRQTQNQLHESEFRIRSLSDNLPNCMMYQLVRELDGSMHFTFVSKAVEQINGVRAEDVLRDSKLLYNQIVAEDLSLLTIAEQRSAEKLDNFDVTVRLYRSDGELRWVQLNSAPRRIEDGRIVWDGLEIDITDRKLAEAEQKRLLEILKQRESVLRESETRLSTIIKNAPIGISFSRGGINIDMNLVCLKMFGYDDPTEMCGHSIMDHIAPQSKAVAEYRMQRRLEGNPIETPIELYGLHKDGSEFPMYVSTKTVLLDDGPLTVGFLIDMTDRKLAETEQRQLQQQLLQSQKMESIGHLAGGIAHDFNNMLNAILGYAQLLKLANASTSPSKAEKTQNYINAILSAGNHAKDLIKQMMVFSRKNPESQEAEKPVTLITPVLKEVISLLHSSIPSSININLHIEDEQLSAHIKPVQLHQILLNLIINARDAIGEYGQIDVRLDKYIGGGTCSACNLDFNGEYVEVTVRDTGSGIPDHILSSIFEPFFTTKSVGKGSGMGLSVVHGHVHSLGGHITVTSEAGQGTTINILLPLIHQVANNPEALLSQNDEEDLLLSGLRIMVIDDERVVSSMLYDLLSFHGAQVIPFNQSDEALAAFERDPHSIDLVVTDETMPGLSGLDMAKAMLKRRSNLPVILCTGYSDHVDAEVAKQSGIAEFIYKPIDVRKLIQRIQALCSK